MRKRSIHTAFVGAVLLACAFWMGAQTAYAQSYGKIQGQITDSQTGEPLIGANVVVEETSKGAATDEQGRYFILQVEPGSYTLVASYIGYQRKTITGVDVRPDLTTTMDIQLAPETIEGDEITIIADQGMVQPDVTFTRRTTSREQMEEAPGIESTEDIFRLQAGAVVDDVPQSISLDDGTQLQVRDESLKNVHIRGGRGGEILYMVDGVPVTHPIYGGRSVMELSVTDVDNMELLTGAFSAEYGQAQSGVIKIGTRSGGDEYSGGLKYKTDQYTAFGEIYDSHYGTVYLSGPEPITSELLPSIGIDLPGRVSFYASGSLDMTDTRFDNRRTRGPLEVLGTQLTEKQQNQSNLNAKLNYRVTPRFEIITSYHGSWVQRSSFDWDWIQFPDHTAGYARDNHSANLQIRHTLSNSTFYNLRFGYLGVNTNQSLDGMTPPDFWTIERNEGGSVDTAYTNIAPPTRDEKTNFFDGRGFENLWIDDVTHSYSLLADITSQIHSQHLIKTGGQLRYHDLQYIHLTGGGLKLSDYGMYLWQDGPEVPRPAGPFPEFSQNRWVFFSNPIEGSWYIQDKFEQRGLIINAGVRVDGFTPGPSVMDDSFKEQWRAATGLETDWNLVRYKVSPRFGISFPISVNTVLFFSYGHFNQLPEIRYYYQEPYTGTFAGNPHLDYEQTILYEFGFTHQFSENWAIDIKSYNKDISGRIASLQLQAAEGTPVRIWDNRGYARARGLEVKLNKRYSNYTSGELTYTMQWATGYSSSAFDNYIRSQNDFPNPIRERRVGWDVRHQTILQGMLRSPRRNPLSLFGLEIPDWHMTILSRFSSGQPYTPGTVDPVDQQKLENTETGPFTLETDVKFRKYFDVVGTRLAFMLEVFNIFDAENANVCCGFNNWTGRPFVYGDVQGNTNEMHDWWDMYYNMNPRQFSNGRRVQVGLQLDL